MKISGVFATVLSLCALFASAAHARNVQLILLIAAALQATYIPDRPTGWVKFFFGNQAAPQIVTKLESYVAAPKTGAMAKSDQRACHEAFLWTLVALESAPNRRAPMPL